MTDKKTYISVVICSFNGGERILACLDSLDAQTYPKDRYEVVVVDDGSTDGTAQAVEARGIRVVRHGVNRGLAAVRNSGLAAARGELIAYIDDDCVADPFWLERLTRPLADPEVTVAGGRIVAYATDHLAERYLLATEYGHPVPLAFGKSKNPLWRFWAYVKNMFVPVGAATKPVEVQAVFTANAAYRISALRTIGGFDEKLVFFEDTDLALRLRREGKRMIFVPDAVVLHRNPENLGDFMVTTYRRSRGIPQYYAKENKILPIFPLPLFYVAIIACLAIVKPLAAVFFLILGPLALYIWWPARAIRDRRPEYLMYGYIQLVLETVTLAGILREVASRRKIDRRPEFKLRSKKIFPFVSVVIATFNRGNVVGSCLESLKRQSYPKDRYEIIVVDDCSGDDTVRIAEEHGVRVLRHKANHGFASARNTGIAEAKGEIIAFIDDDAVADPDWLEYLVQPFGSPEIAGSGGQTLAYKTDRFAERYLAAIGYGNPAPLAFGKSKNPLWRFLVYLKNMFAPISVSAEPTEVQAVFGLNCAFRSSVLRAAGGFDETLLADEDTELSNRLRNAGARIMFISEAKVRHRHRESLPYLLRQTYRRSQFTFQYYAKEKKTLPIFPLPLAYLAASVILIAFKPVIGALFVIVGPFVLYLWWPVRGFRNRSFEYFAYGYVQLALEFAAIAGMARGMFRGITVRTA